MVGAFSGQKPAVLRSPNTRGGDTTGITNKNPLSTLLTFGDTITLSGKQYRLYPLGADFTSLELPKSISKKDAKAYNNALEELNQAAQTMMLMSNRLVDSQDGLTSQGADILARNMSHLSPAFAKKIQGYLLGLLAHGGTNHQIRASVIIPPCERAEFEAEFSRIPKDALKGFDLSAWLGHVYDHVPRAAQGFYRFNSGPSWQNFENSLGERYARIKRRLRTLFNKGVRGVLSLEDAAKYDRLSQQLVEIQKKRLTSALEGKNNEYARALSTRVMLSVDRLGRIRKSVQHYTEAFEQELSGIRASLLKARDALPEWASELRTVLAAQADWCIDTSRNPDWGNSLKIWLNATDTSGILDVSVTAEEKASRIGAKGVPHLLVSQHAELPPYLESILETVKAQAAKKNINILLLKTLLVGGFATYYTISGENLPDEKDPPPEVQKSMTFTNTSGLIILVNAKKMATVAGTTEEHVRSFKGVPEIHVILHEFGHTMGDHAKWLGELAGSVEETNAQASSIYLTHKFKPESLEGMLIQEACWTPVRRTMAGPAEQHSHSDIVLVDEYLKSGGLRIVKHDDTTAHLEIVDTNVLVQTAFDKAIQMRLWEKGIPTGFHAQFQEPVNQADVGLEQEARILKTALDWKAARPEAEQKRMQATTLGEVTDYFADERLHKIGRKLDPVIRSIPPDLAMAIIPTYEPIAQLVA